ANISNYCDVIKDMIGIRILHLYKEDWLDIHSNIKANWEQDETPIANIKKGDKEDVFIKNGCNVKVHELGYRSVHYSIRCNTGKEIGAIAEIQVRTLFEEAWSEMDHEVRYPYYQNDPILGSFLQTFSGIVGNADSMGSFVIFLKNQLYKSTDSEGGVSFNQVGSKAVRDFVNAEEKSVIDNSVEADDEDKLRNIYNSLNYGGHNNYYIQNFAVTEFKNFPVEKLVAASPDLQENIGKSLVEIAPSNNNSGSYQARDFLEELRKTEKKYPVNFVKGIFISTLKRYNYLWICSEYFNTALQLTFKLSEIESLNIIDAAIKELSEEKIEIFHGGKKCEEVISVIKNHLDDNTSSLLKSKLKQLANIMSSLKEKGVS
ncbi:MAG TPA: RelA/SpoT domain-containing protein, partial [Clostridia bacterium]|nr:RelA/SpoT domain-containing protein [Clostridia bacterium]